MIAVVGWPRSGTSLLMQVLAAGGLNALMSRRARHHRPGNHGGVWELNGLLRDPWLVKPYLAERDTHVKLLHRPLQNVLSVGLVPAAAVVTDRDPGAVLRSRSAMWPNDAVTIEGMLAVREQSRAMLAAANVPIWEVDIARLVQAEPLAVCEEIAAFLAPHIDVALNVAAMASVPDPEQLHE